MDHDLYESQNKAWKMIKGQRKDMIKIIRIDNIIEEQWIKHFTKLTGEGEEDSREGNTNETHGTVLISGKELQE